MNQGVSQAWPLVQVGLIMGGVVGLVALLVWLVGLFLVLRGSAPKDRPPILLAYAACRLPSVRVNRQATHPLVRDRPRDRPDDSGTNAPEPPSWGYER
jgi:hypothetical protein